VVVLIVPTLDTLLNATKLESIGLYHTLNGITNLKYKVLCFLTTN